MTNDDVKENDIHLTINNAYSYYLSTLAGYPATITYTNEEKESTMSLFNWFLVPKFEEGRGPEESGFITAADEGSAREFIVRSLDADQFSQYKEGQFVLVVIEVDSWEI